jgi:cytochrome c oxidase assembly protein subunit 15
VSRLARFAWLTLAYNLAVILWGAVVRATGSGAGCGSHWPLCNGEMVPRAKSVETVIEFSHRATSGLALLLVVGLVVWTWRATPRGHAARKAAAWSLLFMLTEAAVGAGLVLFELVADNESMARAMFMGTHLINTFFLVAALTLTAHFTSGGAAFRVRGHGWRGASFLLACFGLLVSGVSGAVAALGDTLFPARTLAEALQQDLSPTAHLLIELRVLHPLLACAAGAAMLLVVFQALRPSPDKETRRCAFAAGGLVLLQLLAGLVNVLLLAPVWLQIVHLLLADLLWIALVLLAATALAHPGSKLVAYWERAGVVGSRPDITDSEAHARSIRKAAEHRERSDQS